MAPEAGPGAERDGHKDYSSTPLWKKLGIREGSRVRLVNAPEDFADRLAPLPTGVELLRRAGEDLDVVVVFGVEFADLAQRFEPLVSTIGSAGRLWVAWPKKAAKVPTDITFEAAQGLGLRAGLVDNKTAALTEVFTGLQFVVRLKDRPR